MTVGGGPPAVSPCIGGGRGHKRLAEDSEPSTVSVLIPRCFVFMEWNDILSLSDWRHFVLL